MDSTKLCRICLCHEATIKFQRFFDPKKNLASELFYVSQIKIIEISKNFPALICPKCEIDLSLAAKFKKTSLLAESFFRQQTQQLEEELLNSCELPFKNENDENQYVVYNEDGFGTFEFVVETVGERENSVEFVEKLEEDDSGSLNNGTIIIQECPNTIQNDPIDDTHSSKVEVLDEFEDFIEYSPTEVIAVEIPPKKSIKREKPRHFCFCGQSFPTKQRFHDHMKVKHTEINKKDLFACFVCDKKFKLQSYLDIHIRNIHTENPPKHRSAVSCSICGKILKSTEALKNHEERHAVEYLPENVVKKFTCDLCGLRFRLKGYIFNHIHNIHLRDKYRCEFCGMGFYKKGEHLEHVVRVHTGERPILCEFEGCGKTFARQKNYNIHKRIHTGERPYSCEHCDKTFIHNIDKKRHVMIHTGEKPYKCDICEKAFTRRNELTLHSRLHV